MCICVFTGPFPVIRRGATLKDCLLRIWKWLLCSRLAFSYTLTGKVKEKGRLLDFENLLIAVYGMCSSCFCT